MIYKYFQWIDEEGRFQPRTNLYSFDVIKRMLKEFDWKYQVFYSIQNYDANGGLVSCPMYFDFDAKTMTLDEVQEEVRDFVRMIELVYKVTPHIHFSGRRGFHVTIPYLITHKRAHEILMTFAGSSLFRIYRSLDASVYSSMRQWRIPGSPSSVPGMFKVPLTSQELFTLSVGEIKEKAKVKPYPRLLDECDVAKIDEDVLLEQIAWAEKKLPNFNETYRSSTKKLSFQHDMTPCLYHMITHECPEGERHNVLFVLGRFMYLCGFDMTYAIDVLCQQEHWKNYHASSHDMESTFKSIWKSKKKLALDASPLPHSIAS